jgi:DNA invertase Pin-like site-specific DNA recombinase
MKESAMAKTKRVALYLRVSKDESTTDNQRRELEEVAQRHGWEVVATFEDEAISGTKGRDKRPAFDKLMKGVSRRQYDMVAAWAVDRIGRNLEHLVGFMNELRAKGIDLYLHQQNLDTSTPSGRAMYQMCGVFAEFEVSNTAERIKAGLKRARAESESARLAKLREGKIKQLTFGRPTNMTPEKAEGARKLLADGVGVNKIAAQLEVGPGLILKIKDGMKSAEVLDLKSRGKRPDAIAATLGMTETSVNRIIRAANKTPTAA